MNNPTKTTEEPKPRTIKLTDSEVEAVREIMKVEAVSPAVRAFVRTRIEDAQRKSEVR